MIASYATPRALREVDTSLVVQPLLFFFLDRTSGEPDLVIVDHEPTDDFEGVPGFELNDFDWHGGRGVAPWVAPDAYAAFDLDGQVLNLVHATNGGVKARHHLASHVEWVLVASGTYDLPRLQELATRSLSLIHI